MRIVYRKYKEIGYNGLILGLFWIWRIVYYCWFGFLSHFEGVNFEGGPFLGKDMVLVRNLKFEAVL